MLYKGQLHAVGLEWVRCKLKIKGGLYLILKHKKMMSSDPSKWLSPQPFFSTHSVRKKPAPRL